MKAIIRSMSAVLMMVCAACSVGPEPSPIMLDDVVRLSATIEPIVADGVSSRLISVTIGEKVDLNATITFETDWGHFGGTTAQKIEVNATGRNAVAELVGDTDSRPQVRVIATVKGYADTLTLAVIPSGPERMRIALEAGVVDADMQKSTTLTVGLIPAFGRQLSKALPVEFYSIPNAGADVVFSPLPVAFAADGVASVKVRSLSRAKGRVTIYALYRNTNGSPVISDTIALELQ